MSDEVYIAGQIEQALAVDSRTHELGVRAGVDGEAVVLHGEVASEERRRLVAEVAAEAAPEMAIRNEVQVTDVRPPEEATA
jgi:osmotically-inducible protein OsmY